MENQFYLIDGIAIIVMTLICFYLLFRLQLAQKKIERYETMLSISNASPDDIEVKDHETVSEIIK